MLDQPLYVVGAPAQLAFVQLIWPPRIIEVTPPQFPDLALIPPPVEAVSIELPVVAVDPPAQGLPVALQPFQKPLALALAHVAPLQRVACIVQPPAELAFIEPIGRPIVVEHLARTLCALLVEFGIVALPPAAPALPLLFARGARQGLLALVGLLSGLAVALPLLTVLAPAIPVAALLPTTFLPGPLAIGCARTTRTGAVALVGAGPCPLPVLRLLRFLRLLLGRGGVLLLLTALFQPFAHLLLPLLALLLPLLPLLLPLLLTLLALLLRLFLLALLALLLLTLLALLLPFLLLLLLALLALLPAFLLLLLLAFLALLPAFLLTLLLLLLLTLLALLLALLALFLLAFLALLLALLALFLLAFLALLLALLLPLLLPLLPFLLAFLLAFLALLALLPVWFLRLALLPTLRLLFLLLPLQPTRLLLFFALGIDECRGAGGQDQGSRNCRQHIPLLHAILLWRRHCNFNHNQAFLALNNP